MCAAAYFTGCKHSDRTAQLQTGADHGATMCVALHSKKKLFTFQAFSDVSCDQQHQKRFPDALNGAKNEAWS
jgi:hypothetical protein